MNDSHPNQKRGLESDDDDFIEVCSPPRKIPSVATAQLDDDTPIVLSSTMINPNVDYPHGRRNCGKNPFSAENAQQYCEKCYCHVCDGPAKECSSWAVHCFAKPITKDFSVSTDEVTILQSTGASAFWEYRMNGRRQRSEAVFDNEADAFWDSLLSRRDPTESRRRKERPAVTKRITDVLAEKLALMVRMTDNKSAINTRKMTEDDFLSIVRSSAPLFNNPVPVASNLKMEGDISELRLHNSFFVEGIRIGWPFSTILTPQRQMAIHIIKALKRKSHVVLESPTGTGKSAAILCSVLAWQRYQAKCSQAKKGQSVGLSQETALTLSCDEDVDIGEATEPDVPTIFYCSRTHSQVAQMVASLRKTPYRPRMTVLGSRERLCINREVKKQKVSSVSINQSCRDRKIETDRKRKKCIKDPRKSYDDDNPVPFPSEEELEIEETYNQGVYNMDTEIRTGTRGRNNRATCLHYQQLSSDKSVRAIKERFIKPAVEINDCCKGDEHTKLGVMDIEDLVEFGKNPFRESGITLYREEANTGPFGFTIEDRQYGGVQVAAIKPSGAADKDGRIKLRDWILSINDVSTKSWTLNQVKNQIVNLKKDPLILTVQRGHAEIDHDNGYSDHALCPYYLARALTSSANLIFAPYNYILDPSIRRTFNLNLRGAVVVLDEAHNIEDMLCESGSGDYGEIDLCHLVSTLTRYSNGQMRPGSVVELLGSGKEESLSSVAHELVLFLELVVTYMQAERKKFETGPALSNLKQEHARFRLSDDHSVEVSYSGPSGFGTLGHAVGCLPKLEELGITADLCTRTFNLAKSLECHLFGGESDDIEIDTTTESVLNDLIAIIGRFELAAQHPEHFYLGFYMRPNGNIDHATEMNTEQYDEIMVHQRWRKHPRVLPLASPKTEQHEYVPLPVCNHESCKSTSSGGYLIGKAVRHGEMCTGDCPLWECHLVLRLLSPGLLMKELSSECRTVILASGSLAPLQSLCAELNLFAPKEETPSISTKEPLSNGFSYNFVDLTSPVEQGTPNKSAVFSGSQNKNIKKYFGRLQVKPKPLEADHVVNLKMQLFACAIGHFPDGKPLTVSYSNYKDDSFFPRLGDALATVIEAIPIGGVLVFFPSYNFLSKCIKCWNPSAQHSGDNPSSASPQVWSRFLESKSKVITEPTGSQDKFEVARNEYNEQIRLQKRCILLAVFRGKMSEGISFNDDHARAVICIGLPFPNSFDRNIRAKKAYNDEQRKICNNSNLLPGTEWYSQQAYRAIAQALGRCIRHGADYGAVILMDSRHCDDGSPNDGIPRCHKNLPKWMRHSMRTLSILPDSGVGLDPIVGGYRGLSQELRVFFQEAPPYANRILEQWRLDLESAQNRSSDQSVSCVFDGASGQWNISSTADRRSRGTTRVESEL